MALLRLSDGRIYTAIADINRLVAPLKVGEFAIAPDLAKKIALAEHPLSQENAMLLIQNISAEDRATLEAGGFKYCRVGNVVPPKQDEGDFLFATRDEKSGANVEPEAMSAEAIADYLVPHHVLVNDWHFVFSGAIVKGVQLADGLQGVVYTTAGNWIRLGPTILNWPIFPYGEGTAAVSFFDSPYDNEHEMDLHPEVRVLPEMKY